MFPSCTPVSSHRDRHVDPPSRWLPSTPPPSPPPADRFNRDLFPDAPLFPIMKTRLHVCPRCGQMYSWASNLRKHLKMGCGMMDVRDPLLLPILPLQIEDRGVVPQAPALGPQHQVDRETRRADLVQGPVSSACGPTARTITRGPFDSWWPGLFSTRTRRIYRVSG